MARGDDRRHLRRIALGDAAAGKKGRFDIMRLEDAQDAPDPGLGSVLRLGVFLVIDLAVLVRPMSSPPENQATTPPPWHRPANEFSIGMKFLQRHFNLL
jgi:hypothetical protein